MGSPPRATLLALLALSVAACSTSSAPGAPEADAAPPPADAAPQEAATDAAPPITDAGAANADAPDVVFNYDDCTNLDFDRNDETAPDASRTIVFSFHATTQQYAPRCMRIKKGQSVTWEGSFADHPLVSAGGDVPSPIDTAMPTGTQATIAFPNEGWYGFEWQVHESPAEYGAILVEP